ncbi:Zinc finger C2H2-type [Arabidopsis thaliana x Arabidopsis arenosa]|uniref:Zinc finger C2H2-type n=1 Tax=Arabidopsis thaliana x Arabidopsis arenosa TaxID=1240361 RepID=A0A8T1YT40_9BRAS|nr:Zinc finger C2H2-type [Arabidopsis thaliana x Arabidopsis arenosa]
MHRSFQVTLPVKTMPAKRMKFWGVEVRNGPAHHIYPGEGRPLITGDDQPYVHFISQVALGENQNNGTEPIQLYLIVGSAKRLIGTLSHERFPQLATSIVLERHFSLSHTWKNGSVFFSGYKYDPYPLLLFLDSLFCLAKPDQVDVIDVDGHDDYDDCDFDDSGEEEGEKLTAEADSEEDDEDDSSDDQVDDSSEEETPKKPEASKKRSAEANSSKNPAPNKKAKFETPQKTDSKKPHVHVATPHPSKQAGKNSGGSSIGETSKQQQTPKSAGAFGCKSCTRTFTSEMGLQSHTKAKHSAAA